MRKLFAISSIAFILIYACRDEIDLKEQPGINGETLVVEGAISNLPGPYLVKLSVASTQLGLDEFEGRIPIQGAVVSIIDISDETSITLDEISAGNYATDSVFQGEVGKTYQLKVTVNGEVYSSNPETILPVVDIGEISFDFNEEIERIETKVSFTDPSSDKNFYLWDWEAYREVITILPPIEGNPLKQDTVDCCPLCYMLILDNEINILDDRLFNGQEVKERLVSQILITKPNQYLVDVNQHNISKEYYEFLRLLQLQNTNEGGPFNPPPFNISGNISKENSEERVLGYFAASSISQKSVQFLGAPYTKTFSVFEGIEDDCRLLAKTDTLRPKNWR